MADTSMKQPLIDETGNPEGYINLAEYDATMMEWPGIAIANIYTGAACDVNALTTAVHNVVANEPGWPSGEGSEDAGCIWICSTPTPGRFRRSDSCV